MKQFPDRLKKILDEGGQNIQDMIRNVKFSFEMIFDAWFDKMSDFIDENWLFLAFVEEHIFIYIKLLLANNPGRRFIAEQ